MLSIQKALRGVSRELVRGDDAVLMHDGAGWHRSKELRWPKNITPLFLRPGSPELNPVERVWAYLRCHDANNGSFVVYDDLPASGSEAWHRLTLKMLRPICQCK